MNMLKKVGGIALIIFVVMSIKLWNKSEEKEEFREHLLNLCHQDSDCIEVIGAYYETCFDKTYSLGGRRRSGSLNSEKFIACLNEESGSEFFAYKEQDHEKG